MRTFGLWKILFLLFCAAVLSSCTRPQEELSKVSISLPKSMHSQTNHITGALSTSDLLGHLIINVSGSGIQEPILFQWDNRQQDGQVNLDPPETFTLDIPQGGDRLIQVLAVYLNTETSEMSFYYGDSLEDISSLNESVSIDIFGVGEGESIISGTVWGRYYDSASGGPTDKVFVKYNPGYDKPSLIIQKSSITNGWFSFFMLQGADLEYVTESGDILFGGPISLDDPMFNPSPSDGQVLRATLPASNRNESFSAGNDWQYSNASIFVYGWFEESPGTASIAANVVCRPSSLSSLTKMAEFTSAPAATPRSTMLSGILDQVVLPTSSELISISPVISNYFINGGVNNNTAACSNPSDEYSSFLNFSPSMIDGQGNDGAGVLYGALRRAAGGNGVTITANTPSAGIFQISGQLLPQTLPLFDSIKSYKRVGAGFNIMDSEQLSCSAISGGGMGFSLVNEIALSSDSFSLNIPISSAEISSQTNVVLCFSNADLIYDSALFIRSDHFNVPPASLAILSISDGPTFNYGSMASATNTDKTFTVTNTGTAMATSMSGSGLTTPYAFKGGSFPGTGGTCGPSLSSSSSCTFVVTFTPPSTGTYPGNININYMDGVGAQVSNRPITGSSP